MSDNNPSDMRLDSGSIHQRLRDHVQSLYLSYAFHIKGAVVAAAGISLYLILTTAGASDKLDRFVFWFASFGFACVTVATWSRGCVFTNWHANGWDVVLPLWTGVWEVLMFAVLSPLPNEPTTRWIDWYLVFGIFSISASLLVVNRRIQARPKEFEAAQGMQALVVDYRRWLLFDACGAAGFGFLSLVAYGVARLQPMWIEQFHLPVGVVMIFVAGVIIYNSSNQYRRIAYL